MPLATMHAGHIGAVGGGFELQRQNNALLYITNLPGNDNDLLSLSLASFPLPKTNSGIVEVRWLNESRKFAGNPVYEDLSVVFKDYVDQQTAAVLAGWRALVHDPVTGKIGLKAQYAKAARAVLYAPDGSTEREYEIQGLWPSSFDPGEADMQGEDGVQITVVFTYDKMVPLFAKSASAA